MWDEWQEVSNSMEWRERRGEINGKERKGILRKSLEIDFYVKNSSPLNNLLQLSYYTTQCRVLYKFMYVTDYKID